MTDGFNDPGTLHDGVLAASGRTLSGRYRLMRVIARGGMAEVWEAVDDVLGRRVAVKLLPPHRVDDAVFVERFRREAVAAARLSSPAIVATYDTGVDGDAIYIVMELVEGRTLRQLLAGSGRLDEGLAIAIAVQVAGALSAAHRAGIVHRDIKPANILVADDDAGPQVKVTDFGIAKAVAAGGLDLTQTGIVLGTPKYLAPEQIQGAADVDSRADLYSLGVVCFEMLTGRVPFDGGNDMATAMAHLNEPAPRVASLRPDVSPGLDELVDHLLRKRPADRPASALAVRSSLDAMGRALAAPTGVTLPVAWPGGDPTGGGTGRLPAGTGPMPAGAGPLSAGTAAGPGTRHAPTTPGAPPTRHVPVASGPAPAGASPAGASPAGASPAGASVPRPGTPRPGTSRPAPAAGSPRGAGPSARPGRARRRRTGRAATGVVAGVVLAAVIVAGLLLHHSGGGVTGGSAPVPIASASVFLDSTGAGHSLDNPGQADQAVTGTGGGWSTDGYTTRNFGGFYDGEGLVLHLSRAADLSQLVVTTSTPGWSASAYVSPTPVAAYAPLSAWGSPAGHVTGAGSTATLSLAGRHGAYVLLWLTQLPPGLHATIDKVTVSS